MSDLIDRDAIPYTMLFKEDWLKGTGREEQGAWKSEIDAMPTVGAIPIEWLARLSKTETLLGHWRQSSCIDEIIEAWRKENG